MRARPSLLRELCSASRSPTARLQQVGRFVVANDYDATARSTRELEQAEACLADASQYVTEKG